MKKKGQLKNKFSVQENDLEKWLEDRVKKVSKLKSEEEDEGRYVTYKEWLFMSNY